MEHADEVIADVSFRGLQDPIVQVHRPVTFEELASITGFVQQTARGA